MGFSGRNQRGNVLRDIGTTIEQMDCKYNQSAFVGIIQIYGSAHYLKTTDKPKTQKKLRYTGIA
jgi:hypothetical protein